LAWVVGQWEGPPWALALAATILGARFTGLAIRRVSRGCAMPGAWTVLAAPANQAWRREGWRRRRQGRRAVPRSWTVRGLAECGVYARGLLRRITRLGGHPFGRITTGGPWRLQGQGRGVARQTLGPEPGTAWQGTGIACTGRHRQRHCPLLVCWEAGDTEPWGRLTVQPPEARTAWWYGVRAWIEPGCKSPKRAGWPWQRPHRTTPARAAHLWLAVAVAPLGLLRVGGEAEETIPGSTVPAVPALGAPQAACGLRQQERQGQA
jgi:hypothetical protein